MAGDRKLGDEWSDWDGQSVRDTSAGKRLFITLSSVFLLLLAGVLLVAWYLVTPRLAQWHPLIPWAILVASVALVGLIGLQLACLVLTLWAGWRLPRGLTWLSRRLLISAEERISALGQRLCVDRDRIAHSLIKLNNELVRREEQQAEPGQVLVLLPRCLAKEQISEARRLAERYGVNLAVVPGGELARQRIREHRPRAVIGVACERDLVSGIRDVGCRLEVLGIPNRRPHGPCKDTLIDLGQLSQAIELWVGASRLPG